MKKIGNLKKVFISSLAVFSLATTAAISGGLSVPNTNLLDNNKSAKDDASTTSDLNPPEANDLYNDYSYASGYVTISNKTTINFYDWFGFNIWTYNASSNLSTLFGATSATISTLKVRSSTDGTQIYVYGYLSDGTSYFFILNVADGSIVQIGGQNALSGANTLIANVNLLTVVDGCAILTQKTPVDDVSNAETITINYSEINLTTGVVTNTNQDITKSKSTWQITSYGQIVSVQKMGTTYIFDVACVIQNGPTSASPCLVLITCKNGAFGTCNVFNFWQSTSPSNVSDLDMLDRTAFTVLNVTSSDGSTLSSYIAVKFDTTDTTTGSTDPNNPQYYSNPGLIVNINMTDSTQQISTYTLSNDSSDDAFAGIIGFLYDKSSDTTYAVVASANSSSKFAIVSLSSTSNSATKWIDFSTIGIQTSNMQIVSINFIPGASNVSNTFGSDTISGYTGYVEIQTETTPQINIFSEQKAFFSLSSDGSTLTALNNLDFSFAMSDSDISSKYNNSKLSADDNTKNQIIADLTNVLVNGTQYSSVTSTNNLTVDSTNNTISGDVTVSIGDYWNSSSSPITRSVNINLGSSSSSGSTTTPTTPTTPSTPSTPSNPSTNPAKPSDSVNQTISNNGSNITSPATSTGAIVGYVILVLVIAAAIIGIALYMHKKSKKPKFATLDRNGKIKRK